jgi:hypothetical protein
MLTSAETGGGPGLRVVVAEVRTTGALLGDVKAVAIIDGDGAMGASAHTQLASRALGEGDDDNAVLALVDGTFHRTGLATVEVAG